jgi:hypothetical protein
VLSTVLVLLRPYQYPYCPPKLLRGPYRVLEGLCALLPTATGSDIASGLATVVPAKHAYSGMQYLAAMSHPQYHTR